MVFHSLLLFIFMLTALPGAALGWAQQQQTFSASPLSVVLAEATYIMVLVFPRLIH